jgi:hypothetical protein
MSGLGEEAADRGMPVVFLLESWSTGVVRRRLSLKIRAGKTAEQEDGGTAMAGKAVVSLSTGLDDGERVTVALLVAVGAAEQGDRPSCS